jgi:hypothetical protein
MAEVFYKALRLVMPEIAQAAGLAADAPTFLSPIIQWVRICLLCGSVYRPLVYQVGHVATATHVHPDCGGIYCYILSPQSRISPLATFTGFVAAVEPLGNVSRLTACGRHCILASGPRYARCLP